MVNIEANYYELWVLDMPPNYKLVLDILIENSNRFSEAQISPTDISKLANLTLAEVKEAIFWLNHNDLITIESIEIDKFEINSAITYGYDNQTEN